MKRGVLLSLGIVFMLVLILVLAAASFKYYSSQDKRFAESASMTRLNDLDTSVEKTVAYIFEQVSGIDYNLYGNKLVVDQNMPYDDSYLTQKLNGFKDYVESKEDEISLQYDEYYPLTVLPVNFSYMQNATNNTIVVKYNNLTYLNFKLQFVNQNITQCESSFNPGSFSMGFLAYSINGSMCNLSSTIDLNTTAYFTANNVKLLYQNNHFYLMDKSDNITVRTVMGFNVESTVMPKLYLSNNYVNIDFSKFKYRKSGWVRL